MNIRGRLMLVLALSAAAGAGACMVVACSSDDTVTTQEDGGGPDSPTPPNPPPPPEPTDGGNDAQSDVVAPPFGDFAAQLNVFVCQKLHDCCASQTGVTTSNANCEAMFDGWQGSNDDLPPAVVDAGKVTYDTTIAQQCFQLVKDLPCGRVSAASIKAIADACYGAAKGTIALNGTGCHTSAECVSTAYCELDGGTGDAGTCLALTGIGTACGTNNEQCSYRGRSGFCQQGPDGGFCAGLLPTGTACDFNSPSLGCSSGVCDDLTLQCGDAGSVVPSGDAGTDFCVTLE